MKLHLPKMLLTALIATGATCGGATGWHGNILYIDSAGGSTGVNRDGIGSITIENEVTNIASVDASGKEAITIYADAGNDVNVVSCINTMTLAQGATMSVVKSSWGPRYFDTLTIDSLNVNNSGSVNLLIEYNANGGTQYENKVIINNIVGSLGTVNVNTGGELTIGTESSTTTLSGTISNRGTLTINGGLVIADFSGFETTMLGSLSNSTHGYVQGKAAYVIAKGIGALNGGAGYSISEIDETKEGIFSTDEQSNSLVFTENDAVETTGTIYHISSEYTEIITYDGVNGDTATATGFELENGTTLQLNASLTGNVTDGISIADSATATIKMVKTGESTPTLNSSSVILGASSAVDYVVDGATLNLSPGSGTNSLTVSNGGTVNVNGADHVLGSANDRVRVTLSESANISFINGASGGAAYMDVNVSGNGILTGSWQGNDLNIQGTITGEQGSTLQLVQRSGSTNTWKISSVISGGLAVTSNALLTLNGANTYTGGTTITGGTLIMGNAQALGTESGVSMSGGTLKLNVDAGIKSLNVTGESTLATNSKTLTVAEGITASEKIVVDGGGKLSVTGNLNTTDTFTLGTTEGTSVELCGADNQVNIFDLSNGGNAKGSLVLKSGSKTTINSTQTGQSNAGALWMQAGTSVLLEETASLTWLDTTVTGKNDGAAITTSADRNVYLEVAEATINNADVTYTGSAETYTVAAKLTNSSITQDGSGMLTVNNAGNTLTAVNARNGNIAVVNTTEGAEMNIASVTVADKKSVSTSVADLTIGTLSLGAGATLAQTGNLTLNGLTFTLADYVSDPILNNPYTLVSTTGTLNLGAGVTVGDLGVVGDYTATLTNTGSSLTLTFTQEPAPDSSITTTISGVAGLFDSEKNMLTLNIKAGDSLAGAGAVTIDSISSDIMKQILGLDGLPADGMVGITLLDENGVAFTGGIDGTLVFRGDTGMYEGVVTAGAATQYFVQYIPEPTTATLSLLALMGLAVRRRRK